MVRITVLAGTIDNTNAEKCFIDAFPRPAQISSSVAGVLALGKNQHTHRVICADSVAGGQDLRNNGKQQAWCPCTWLGDILNGANQVNRDHGKWCAKHGVMHLRIIAGVSPSPTNDRGRKYVLWILSLVCNIYVLGFAIGGRCWGPGRGHPLGPSC